MSYFKVFIALTFFQVVSSIILDDLKRICCLDCGKKEISKLPEVFQCTAIAKYDTAVDVTDDEIYSLQNGLPYLYIYDGFNMDDFNVWIEGNLEAIVYDIIAVTISKKVQIMVIDLHPHNDKSAEDIEFTENFLKNVKTLFKLLKEEIALEMPGGKRVLFGLGISGRPDVIDKIYDPKVTDEFVDFYVVRTMFYHKCEWHKKQKDMANTAPYDEMKAAVDALKTNGFDMKKTILSIEVVANSIKNLFADKEDWSYKYMCESSPGDTRKFCFQDLNSYYDKAKLIFDEKMLGVLVKSVDRDDYDDKCKCQKDPVLRLIKAGMEGKPKPDDITSCNSWGKTKRDK